MKHPVYLLVCAILGLFANRAPAAETTYTVKIAVAIPFDFRDTGAHYTIPVVDNNTPITITVRLKPSEDLQKKIQELSRAELGNLFSDIKRFNIQIIPLTTESILGSANTYLSLWLAPAVPQTEKVSGLLTLGHITGLPDNTQTLNELFGLDLLKKLTESINQYFQTKPPLFRYVFLFAQNNKGEIVVAYTKTELTNIREIREAHQTNDYEQFGVKKTEQTVLRPTIDLSWNPEFLMFYILGTDQPGKTLEINGFAYPYYYCTALPAEVISAQKPAIKFSTISELEKTSKEKDNGVLGLLLRVDCPPLLENIGAKMPLHEQNVRVLRPQESLEARAAYEINSLFNKLYLEPFAKALYRLAKQ